MRRGPNGRRDGCLCVGALAPSVAAEHRGAQGYDLKCKTAGCRRFLGWDRSGVRGHPVLREEPLSASRAASAVGSHGPGAVSWRGSRAACVLSHWTHGWCVSPAFLLPEIGTLSASAERPGLRGLVAPVGNTVSSPRPRTGSETRSTVSAKLRDGPADPASQPRSHTPQSLQAPGPVG